MKNNIIEGAKYFWQLPQFDSEKVNEFAQTYNLSFAIVQTLLNRGYQTRSDLDSYLFSIFERDVGHASLLKDSEKAVDRILHAIKSKEKILIVGDYDVDGITSSAMMMFCLLPLGANINYFLPNRVKDGYGISGKIVKRAAENNYKLLITVDNGISAFEAGVEAKKFGIDLIITDHHKPHDKLPEAFAIINPHQKDCIYPFKKLAGVGVIFKVLDLLYQKMRLKLPEKVYELLLLGTIADVVPLTGENRYWVRHGLKLVNKNESFPLKVLKQNSKFSKPSLSSLDIGFFLAPQINALGRLEDPRQGVRFLIGSDSKEVQQVGSVLAHLNEARKAIEREIFDQVAKKVNEKEIDLTKERIVLASSDNWQPGVIGLVASRIVGAYNRPAILFHITKKGIAKGSCRSVPEFNIFEALKECKDLLISFGGHSMAAGLALKKELLSELKLRLEAIIKEKIPELKEKPALGLDAEVSLNQVNKKLIKDMSYLEPFGNENSQPVFYLKNVSLVKEPTILKDVHVKCLVFSDGIIKPVIFFNRPDIYDIILKKGDNFSLAVYAMENYFNGKSSVELQGIDIAL